MKGSYYFPLFEKKKGKKIDQVDISTKNCNYFKCQICLCQAYFGFLCHSLSILSKRSLKHISSGLKDLQQQSSGGVLKSCS